MEPFKMLHTPTERIRRRDGRAGHFALDLALTEEPMPSRNISQADFFRACPHTKVQIVSSSGFGVFGILKSIARGGMQVFTTIVVPIHSPLEVTISGCLPISGEAYYSIKRHSFCQVGIVFSDRHMPKLLASAPVTVSDVASPFDQGSGTVVEIVNSSLSVVSEIAVAPESWVRVETNGWVLFGVIRDCVPLSAGRQRLRIHLAAALPSAASRRSLAPATEIGRLPSETLQLDYEFRLKGEMQ
jgi:hypothetical protein